MDEAESLLASVAEHTKQLMAMSDVQSKPAQYNFSFGQFPDLPKATVLDPTLRQLSDINSSLDSLGARLEDTFRVAQRSSRLLHTPSAELPIHAPSIVPLSAPPQPQPQPQPQTQTLRQKPKQGEVSGHAQEVGTQSEPQPPRELHARTHVEVAIILHQ
jgi:hypothetical protein